MKKFFLSFIVLTTILFNYSCSKEDLTTFDESATLSYILSDTSFTFSEADAEETGVTVTITEPNVGFSAAPEYRLYFDFVGGDFSNAEYISLGNSEVTNVKVIDLNTVLINLGVPALTVTNVDVKAAAVYGPKIIFSEKQQISVSLYPTEYPNLYLVGDATASGWDNNSNNYPLFKDPVLNGRYYYKGYFAAGNIKLLESKGNWQPQWGRGATAGSLAGNPATQSGDPETIPVATAGYYTLFVDLVNLTYTLTPFDASASINYPTIGILGAATATGWGSDTDMVKSSFDPHIWYITSFHLNQSAGGDCDCGFKFRANNAWDSNWGGAENPPSLNYGVGALGGKNIGVPTTGNYLIFFNDLDMRYTYILLN